MTYDVAVVGGGVAGAAAALGLADRGARVALIERFAPGHERGSSHGDGRILRTTYPEPVYLEMARLAYRGWAELERRGGERLVERTGSWECGPPDSPPLLELVGSFERHGIAHERLGATESARRFPHFRLPPGSLALYQADGGVVRAGRAVAVLWRLGAAAGVEAAPGERIEGLDVSDRGVEVASASGRRWRARRLVVAAGGWSGPLLAGLGLALPLEVTQEVVAYFPPSGEVDHRAGAMPTVIDYHAEKPFYALPVIDVAGVKAGWHRSGPAIDPERPLDEPPPEILERLAAWVGERLPHLATAPLEVKSCLYTNTPDYHFVLDRHPDLPEVAIGTGFSGHGFKFAPVVGEILAALALDEQPPVDLETFAVRRLLHGDPARARRRSA